MDSRGEGCFNHVSKQDRASGTSGTTWSCCRARSCSQSQLMLQPSELPGIQAIAVFSGVAPELPTERCAPSLVCGRQDVL